MINPTVIDDKDPMSALSIELFGCRHADLDSSPGVTHVRSDIRVRSVAMLRHRYFEFRIVPVVAVATIVVISNL